MWIKVCVPRRDDKFVNLDKVHRIEFDSYGEDGFCIRAFLDDGGMICQGSAHNNQVILYYGPLEKCNDYLDWLENELDICGNLLRYEEK